MKDRAGVNEWEVYKAGKVGWGVPTHKKKGRKGGGRNGCCFKR